jgi:hypothetical protein
MDQDDPERRIAELERQLAEQKRIAELEHQIAQANAAAHGQDAPMQPPPQWPGRPPSPSAPHSGQLSGFQGSWVSVDGGGFQPSGGQGFGAVLPPQAAEQLAGLVDNIVHQAEVSGQQDDPEKRIAPMVPGLWFFPPRGAGVNPVAYWAFMFVLYMFLPYLFLVFATGSPDPSWMSSIVCDSHQHLTSTVTRTFGGDNPGIWTTYQCAGDGVSRPVSGFIVDGVPYLLAVVALFGAYAIAAVVWLVSHKWLWAWFAILICAVGALVGGVAYSAFQ